MFTSVNILQFDPTNSFSVAELCSDTSGGYSTTFSWILLAFP